MTKLQKEVSQKKPEAEELTALYKVDNRINSLINNYVDEETGEIPEAVFAELEKLEMDHNQLIGNIAIKHKLIGGFIANAKNEIDRIKKLIQYSERQQEAIENYLSKNLTENLITTQYEIKFRNSEAIELEEGADIEFIEAMHPELIRVKKELDKTAAKKLIKDGTEIDGVKLITRRNISVR